jgi:hypothetical protein
LAPAINSTPPDVQAELTVTGSEAHPVAVMTRRSNQSTFVFAVGMTDQTVPARFRLPGASGDLAVLGESRKLQAVDGNWSDTFKGYEVHLYVLNGGPVKP